MKHRCGRIRSWGFCAVVLLSLGALPALGADVPGSAAPPPADSSGASVPELGSGVSPRPPQEPGAFFRGGRADRIPPLPVRKTPLYLDPASDDPNGEGTVPAGSTTPPTAFGGMVDLFLMWFPLG